uniref:Putative secreted protein n=1 Tax=Ixodes ricinus TaxID=34613 RepID=A0A6B0U7U7_IXORI
MCTLDAKLLLIVFFTIRLSLPAHIFAVQHDATARTLEAPDVPLLFQRYQRLPFPQIVRTAGTLNGPIHWGLLHWLGRHNGYLNAL